MTLFKETLTVVNVGLKGFGDDIVAAGGRCVALSGSHPRKAIVWEDGRSPKRSLTRSSKPPTPPHSRVSSPPTRC